MLARIKHTLSREALIVGNAPILVAVSGGADSLALLHLLHELGLPLICAHFDHQLRPEGKQEADRVHAGARTLGIPFILGAGDVPAFRAAYGLSIEEAARQMRYRFLFEQARAHGAQAVATGHTADDQAETVLMHLLRGAGLAGLKGMLPKTILPEFDPDVPLIRPLLGLWRTEIEAYCRERGLQPNEDPSNRDTAFFRNRLRHELIPALETYNSGIREHLWKMAHTLAADERVLADLTAAAWVDCITESGGRYVGFDRQNFLGQPEAIRARLLRRAVEALLARPSTSSGRDASLAEPVEADFNAVQRGLDLVGSGQAFGQCDLVDRLCLFAEGDVLWVARTLPDLPLAGFPQVPPGAEFTLDVGERLALPNGWALELTEGAAPSEGTGGDRDRFEARVDLDKLNPPVRVRSRRAGDRIAPSGLGGHSMKVSDLMVNEKIPRRARAGWPLVVSGEVVVWVAGVRLGENFRVTGETVRIGKFSLRRGHS